MMEHTEIMDNSKPVHKIVVMTKSQQRDECRGSNYSRNESSKVPNVTRITREARDSNLEDEAFPIKTMPGEKIDNFASEVDDCKVVIKVNTGKSRTSTSFPSCDDFSVKKNVGHIDLLDVACAELQCENLTFEESDLDGVEKGIIGTKMNPSLLPMMTEHYKVCGSLQPNFDYLHGLEADMNKYNSTRKVFELGNMMSVYKHSMDVQNNLDALSHPPNLKYDGASEFEPPIFPVMCNTVPSGLEGHKVSPSSSSCMNNEVSSNNAEPSQAPISDNRNYLKPVPSGFNIYASPDALRSTKNHEWITRDVNNEFVNAKDRSLIGGGSNMSGPSSNVNSVELVNEDNKLARICKDGDAKATSNCCQSFQINSTNQAELIDDVIKPPLPLKYTISLPDRPFFAEDFNIPPDLHQIDPDDQILLSFEVENKLHYCAQRFNCHPTALVNGRFVYHILEESGSYFPFSTEEKIVSSLVFGGIASRYPLVLTQKLRRAYRLQFTLPILIAIVIPRRPGLPIDLDPRAYLDPLMAECGLTDDETKNLASKLLMSLHTLEYRETGMSQQWAVAALLRTIRVSKKSYRDVTSKLKNYSKSIKVLDYTIKRLAKIDILSNHI